jgi:hypothetical protein
MGQALPQEPVDMHQAGQLSNSVLKFKGSSADRTMHTSHAHRNLAHAFLE